MRTPTQEEFIQIIRFEICGTPLPQGFAVSDEAELIKLAKRHDLTHLVYDALTKNGLPCKSSFAMQQYFAAIWRAEQMEHELQSIAALFEAEGIDFLPLKGAVMRPMYPESWMRTSADIDVLVKPQDQLRARDMMVNRLGYTTDPSGLSTHHVGVSAPESNVHVELHNTLFTDYNASQDIKDIARTVWDHSELKVGSAHWYLMSDAMFYFYHLAHMAKHIRQAGGCPVRGLIDLWLLDKHPGKDEECCMALLKEGGLATFAEIMSGLAKAWLEGGPVPSEELEQYILSAYLYGNIDRRTANSVNTDGTARYILKKIFLPYDVLKYAYPVLKTNKWLTPVFQVVRWTRVFSRKHRHDLKNQAKAMAKTDEKELEESIRINRLLGFKTD